jgi:response regulator RpfG family c-di-GMP phosphodiesterase
MTPERPHGRTDAAELVRLAGISSGGAGGTVERVLDAAREMLGMDVAFVAEFAGERLVFRAVGGAAESFGWSEGASVPLEGTYWRGLVEGRLPGVVPDARSDERVRDLDMTREAGVGAYLAVPLRFSDGRLYGALCAFSHSPAPSLEERDARFLWALGRLVAEQLEREEFGAQNERLAIETTGLQALLSAIEARDSYMGDHSRSVAGLATQVARRMGLPEEEVAVVQQAAFLHDVGKVAIPDSILKKRGPLDDAELETMRAHAALGARMIASIPGLAHLAPVIKATHERWNGEGYPDELSGEEIPLASRIVHACDAWHAMTSDRPYREALGREAIDELRTNMGEQFDPRVALALVDVVEALHPLSPEERERMINRSLFVRGLSRSTSGDGLRSASTYTGLRGL